VAAQRADARVKIDTGIGTNLASVPTRTGQAEAAGLDCLWAAETVNDPFLSLAIAAEHSERMSIGTAVAIAFARNPMSLAYTANQLQEFSSGRMILGLGSQVRSHIERRFSTQWSRPAARMREFVLAMRAVWASWNDGARLDFNGEFYTHTLMTPVFAPRPNPFGAPRVFVAAVGERMTEVAGEVADGVITHGVSSPRYLREVTLPALQRGLDKSGRTRADVEVTCPGFVAVADTDEQLSKVRAGMRRHLSYYASTPAYRPVLELHGWGDLQTELYACSKRGEWEPMSALVSDEMLDTLAIIATPDKVAAEIGSRYGGLADRITVSWWRKSWGPAVNEVLRTL
jgi:probable F420-dependent oxidoreductase